MPTTYQQGNNPAWDIAQPNVQHQTNEARRIYEQGAPGYYPGQQVAQLTPEQLKAHGLATNQGAGQQAALADQGTATGIGLQQGVPQSIGYHQSILAGSNPYLQNLAQQGTNAVNQAWGQTGTFGSARHSLAAQNAAQQNVMNAQQQSANALAQLGLQGAGLTQGLQSAALSPAQTFSDVGSQLQAQNQANIDADIAKYNYNANLPSSWLQNYIGSTPGAGINPGTTQQNTQQKANTFEKVLGIGSVLGGLFG